MANTLDIMDLKQILQLHSDKLSNREIGTILGISRNTVNQYIRRFKSSEYSIKELLAMDRNRLEHLFTYRTTIDIHRHDELMRYFEQMKKARDHPGFTFLYHYHEYASRVENPYGYTQFLEHYRRKYASQEGSMKLNHEAGKEMFIDFAGKKLSYIDKTTGEIKEAEVFVAILPHSHYTYVEATASQKREDLIHCCIQALTFYGGVPKAIVSDNLKSAVTRASKYEATINRSFKEFGLHYGCVINPTRSYSPQDKALVENAVRLAYQRIYYPLREMTFFSLEDLNTEIRKRVEDYNKHLLQRREVSRLELFQRVERAYLKPLPVENYVLKDYRRAKVQKMGYVYLSCDKNYYSVPYRYIGKQTTIHYSQKIVEVYYNNTRIALHQRAEGKGRYITCKDHLSSTHKFYVEWSPEFFKNKAVRHGPYVVECVGRILSDCVYPEVGYKRTMGLLQLHKTYGSRRLNDACKIALEYDMASYKRIENLLKNKMDLSADMIAKTSSDSTHIPPHKNIRGASSYQ